MQPLIAQFQAIELDAGALGLKLNHLKCKIIGISDFTRLSWVRSDRPDRLIITGQTGPTVSSLLGIPEVIVAEASLLGASLTSLLGAPGTSLLGAPLRDKGVQQVLKERMADFNRLLVQSFTSSSDTLI